MNCNECSKNCCPFAYTEESETVQNYGCLPTPMDIMVMRLLHKRTWACHANPSKPCLGAINELRELGADCSVVNPLVTENDNWSKYTSIPVIITHKDKPPSELLEVTIPILKLIYDKFKKYRVSNESFNEIIELARKRELTCYGYEVKLLEKQHECE